MCASDADARQSRAAADDVWADSDSGGSDAPGDSPARTQLDREWEARKQQFYNAGYREGVEEGKEVTLQQGFNAGFAEGAQAGFNFGLVQSALQVLAAQLPESDSRQSKVQELLQQVSGLSTRTVMQDTCKALLTGQPDDIISQHLQAALTLHQEGTSPTPNASSSSQGTQPPPPAAGASGSSTNAATDLPLPMQLVADLQQELQQLGFDVGSAPALTVASGSQAAVSSGIAEEEDKA